MHSRRGLIRLKAGSVCSWCVVTFLLASGAAGAADGRSITMEGSRSGALACSQCHGADGAGLPRLAELNAA
jgi:cytochrome c553